MQEEGIKDVYAISPNYQAGRDMITGFKRTYKGNIVEEIYTKLGQQDYQAEITQLRSKNPKAVFVFLPGGMGIQFMRQYAQAGLKDQIPLYSVFTVDELSIPAVKDAALGQWETRHWSPDLDNPANKRFVADYRKKHGSSPVFYGAQSYDGILLIDSAVRAVKGNLKDTKGMIAAMRKADYASVRGPYEYNVNHVPVQNFYLLRAEKEADGKIEMHIKKTVFKDYKDSYYKDCPMKW
jgi:branched-chain amino acid transport system substrate-binding protein